MLQTIIELIFLSVIILSSVIGLIRVIPEINQIVEDEKNTHNDHCE